MGQVMDLFSRKAYNLHRRITHCPPRWVFGSLAGKRLKVREGTLRARPDYDDAWLFCAASRAETVFDIGCNLGQAALICLAAGPPQTLVLVDPNPLALSIAAENMIHNGFASRVRLVCAFVDARSEGKQKFYTVGEGAAGSRYPGHAQTARRRNAWFEAERVTLGELAEIYGAPDLIKIDVEGAETSVLEGITDTVLRKQPRLLVEVHSPPELPMVRNAERILDWCEGQGYKAFYLAGKILLEEPHPLASRGRCHLLLFPESQAVPEWAQEVPERFSLERLHSLPLFTERAGGMGTSEGARRPSPSVEDS